MKAGLRALAVAVVVASVAACAVPVPIPVPVGGDAVQGQPEPLSRVGRFALTVSEVGGKQNAVQGGFAWRDDGTNLTLDLVSPVGQTLARVEAGQGGALLREANGRETRALNPDALVALVLGSRIPVSGLREWLRGTQAADPVAVVLEKDSEGRPALFTQAGWQVRVNQYDQVGPTRMLLQRTEANGQDIDLRLVVN